MLLLGFFKTAINTRDPVRAKNGFQRTMGKLIILHAAFQYSVVPLAVWLVYSRNSSTSLLDFFIICATLREVKQSKLDLLKA